MLRPRTAALRLLGRGVCYPASGIGEEEALETAGPAPTITREQPESRRGWSDEGAGLNVRKGAARSEFATLLRPRTAARRGFHLAARAPPTGMSCTSAGNRLSRGENYGEATLRSRSGGELPAVSPPERIRNALGACHVAAAEDGRAPGTYGQPQGARGDGSPMCPQRKCNAFGGFELSGALRA